MVKLKLMIIHLKTHNLNGLIGSALRLVGHLAKLNEIRQILADSGSREFDSLFKYLYDNVDNLFPGKEGEAILIIAIPI